jgi:NADH-quinone oxidoreductase subunit E
MVIGTRADETQSSLADIDSIISKHNMRQGNIMPILQEIQSSYGYIPSVAVHRISENLNVSVSEIYGVATFYSQFKLRPVAKNVVKVCHGTACHLNGAERVSSAITKATGAKEGENSPDGLFTVEKVACLGCCSLAPCVMVNEEVHGRLNADEINKVIDKCKEDETEK